MDSPYGGEVPFVPRLRVILVVLPSAVSITGVKHAPTNAILALLFWSP